MTRVRLKGINSITKQLADGTQADVLVRLERRAAAARQTRNAGVHRQLQRGRREKARRLAACSYRANDYQASEDFTELADSTRRSYVAMIKRIEKEFGDFPLSALTDRRTRGIFMAWRDRSPTTPDAGRPITLGPCLLA